MTTEIPTITCAALYEADPTFRGLVDEWVVHRRCPIPLIDRCLDFGLDKAANCARWAVETPEREVHYPLRPVENPNPCGPFPTLSHYVPSQEWFWHLTDSKIKLTHQAHTVPVEAVPIGRYDGERHVTLEADSPEAAIVLLLDNWVL